MECKTMKIGILADDGFKRTMVFNERGQLIGYSGFAKDFKPKGLRIIDKNASAQEIIDDVESWRHVPWD